MKKYKTIIRAIVCAIVAALIYFIGLNTGKIDPLPEIKLSLTHFLNAALIILGAFAIEGIITFILGLFNPKSNRVKTVISLAKNILQYAFIIIAFCMILTVFNVDIVTILAGLGIIALIIGFGAESLIADIVTGMFILIDNQYNVGDIIEVNGFRGTVTEINVRTTSIMDPGGNVKIINNSEMKNILNRSNNASKAVVEFPIPYETDIVALENKIPDMLNSIYEKNKDLFKSEPKYLGVESLSASSVDLKFIAEVGESDIYSGTRALKHDLFIGMREIGIECPFTQIDIHNK